MSVSTITIATIALAIRLITLFGLIALAGNAAARVTLPLYDEPAVLSQTCQATLSKAREQTKKLAALPLASVNVSNTLGAWNRLQMELEDMVGPVYLYGSVHTDKKCGMPRIAACCNTTSLILTCFKTRHFTSAYLKFVHAIQAPHQKKCC